MEVMRVLLRFPSATVLSGLDDDGHGMDVQKVPILRALQRASRGDCGSADHIPAGTLSRSLPGFCTTFAL